MTTEQLGGLRFDAGKLRLDLIPAEILIELGGIYTEGSVKYFDNNWRGGMEWGKMLACHDRHYLKWKMGLRNDPELNRNHLAIAAWNLLALLVYEKQGKGYDNRILPEETTINEEMEWVELSEEQRELHAEHNRKVMLYNKEKHDAAKAPVEHELLEPSTDITTFSKDTPSTPTVDWQIDVPEDPGRIPVGTKVVLASTSIQYEDHGDKQWTVTLDDGMTFKPYRIEWRIANKHFLSWASEDELIIVRDDL